MIRRAGAADIPAVLDIRVKVFIEEQGVSEADEWDGLDDHAIHLTAFRDGIAVGTARLLIDGETGKIGRVAVLRDQRGTGLGKALIRAALEDLRAQGLTQARLESQTHAIGFYESLGFTVAGPEFMDAGIPHRDMVFAL